MRGKLHLVAALLFLATLLYDLVLWGGVGYLPELGPVAIEATQREVSLAAVYLPVGRLLVGTLGVQDSAAGFAGEQFSAVQPRVLANRAAAADTLVRDMPGTASAAYYGAPLLAVIAAFLWWRRPRVVHTMRGR